MRRANLVIVVFGFASVSGAASGCGGSGDDDRTVAGRTRSLSRAGEADRAPSARLRRRETSEQATGVTTARLSATLAGGDLAAAALRLPGGEEVAMISSSGAFVATLEGTVDALRASCPPGGYTFAARASDGAISSLTLEVAGTAPPVPVVTAPTDMALVAAGELAVGWSFAGSAALFDVELFDVATSARVYRAVDLGGVGHLVPAGAIAPGRYRLEVTAASGRADAAVRLEATGVVTIDVVAR